MPSPDRRFCVEQLPVHGDLCVGFVGTYYCLIAEYHYVFLLKDNYLQTLHAAVNPGNR